ncbi:MAG TPA: hypothetical protein PLQ74_09655 [Pseudomonadota bacterium]|nr:hypothetical protein [Rhodanobacteraceae bacterium]MBP9154143.1 hypothetical protein [Xanthomonadales bacterium]HQW82119.1 hypothetical protein [Pseudomonadota bacterium]
MTEFQQWIASRGGACWPSGGDQFLWVASDRRRSVLLSRAEAVVWQMAMPFQSRAALIAAAQERQAMPPDVATAALARLEALGLVVTPTTMIGDAVLQPAAPAPVIAVRTYRRPQALARLLDSALDRQRRSEIPRSWLIIDDARTDADAADNADVIARATSAGLDLMYLGPTQRRDAMAALYAADDPRIACLLDPTVLATASGARSWNWAMLLTAGGTVSMIDDDCFLPVCRPPSWQRHWSMQNAAANEGRFFDGAMPSLAEMQEDPWQEALAVLGQSPGALAQRDGLLIRQVAGQTIEQLSSWNAGRRVAAVIAGIHGGHVFNSALYLNITDSHSLRDLLREPFELARLQGDRLWQGVTVPRLTSNAAYTPFLIDNRELVPFAPTAGRADDTAFLGVLSAIAPDSSFAMLPMLIGHAPVDHRDRLDAMFRELLIDGNTFLSGFAHQVSPQLRGRDRGARLRAIAALAANALACNEADWQADVTAWRNRVVASALEALAQSLKLAGTSAPAEWCQAINRADAVNRAALSTAAPAALVAGSRCAFEQLSNAAEAWTGWWAEAASGGSALWRDRLQVRV